ncbi:hypothetical protein TruAng_009756 [Truncatella angustata]|nr:hypothetical protein TruAng_009756 [Truncatella angustata]
MDNKFLDKPSAEQYEVMGTEPLESPKTRDEFIESYVIDTEEERKLVRKIDLYILPTMWIMYLLSYMDRTNIGNAKIAGMAEDLGLDSNRYSISLIVFFVGYVIWEVPSNMILAQTKPSIFLPTIMFLWGCATIGMAFIDTYKALVGLRILIGLLESGFAPGVLLLLSSWYKPDEQARRFGVYISAAILSGAFGGLIAGSITGGLDGVNGMAGWRWLFITEGAATAVWSIVASFLLMDFPANTKRLTEPERELALKRLMASDGLIETEDSPKLSHWQALKEALINWRVWGFVVGYMAVSQDSVILQQCIVVVFMDKYPKWRGLVLACAMGVSMLMAIIICVVYDFKVRYALLVIMACGLWASNGLSLAYASSTFRLFQVVLSSSKSSETDLQFPRSSKSAEVRGISLAFINAMGNLAQIYGSYL